MTRFGELRSGCGVAVLPVHPLHRGQIGPPWLYPRRTFSSRLWCHCSIHGDDESYDSSGAAWIFSLANFTAYSCRLSVLDRLHSFYQDVPPANALTHLSDRTYPGFLPRRIFAVAPTIPFSSSRPTPSTPTQIPGGETAPTAAARTGLLRKHFPDCGRGHRPVGTMVSREQRSVGMGYLLARRGEDAVEQTCVACVLGSAR